MIRFTVSIACIALLAGCATVDSERTTNADLPSLEQVNPPQFLAMLDSLDVRLEQGDPRELNDIEQRRYDRISRSLRVQLSGLETINQLTDDEQIDVFNSTEELWATVVGREEDQIICRRVHQVGTNFQKTTCKTIAEIRQDQERSRSRIREVFDNQPVRPVGPPRVGGG